MVVGMGVGSGVGTELFSSGQLYLKIFHPTVIYLKLQILSVASCSKLGHPCQTVQEQKFAGVRILCLLILHSLPPPPPHL